MAAPPPPSRLRLLAPLLLLGVCKGNAAPARLSSLVARLSPASLSLRSPPGFPHLCLSSSHTTPPPPTASLGRPLGLARGPAASTRPQRSASPAIRCTRAAATTLPALLFTRGAAWAAAGSLPIGAVSTRAMLGFQLSQLLLSRAALCLVAFSVAAVVFGGWLFRRSTGESFGASTFKVIGPLASRAGRKQAMDCWSFRATGIIGAPGRTGRSRWTTGKSWKCRNVRRKNGGGVLLLTLVASRCRLTPSSTMCRVPTSPTRRHAPASSSQPCCTWYTLAPAYTLETVPPLTTCPRPARADWRAHLRGAALDHL